MTKAKTPTHKVYFRRRREGKTNYSKRLAFAKSDLPRLVVRKTNRNIILQIVKFDYAGDTTLASFSSSELAGLYKWPAKRNTHTAYLAGLQIAKKAKEKKVENAVLDIGMHTPSAGSIVFAAAKGAIDGGLKVSCSEEKIPLKKLSDVPAEIKNAFEQTKKLIISG